MVWDQRPSTLCQVVNAVACSQLTTFSALPCMLALPVRPATCVYFHQDIMDAQQTQPCLNCLNVDHEHCLHVWSGGSFLNHCQGFSWICLPQQPQIHVDELPLIYHYQRLLAHPAKIEAMGVYQSDSMLQRIVNFNITIILCRHHENLFRQIRRLYWSHHGFGSKRCGYKQCLCCRLVNWEYVDSNSTWNPN